MLGNNDLDAIAKLDFLCDDIGLDTISTGVALAVAMDAGYREFGDAGAAIEMVEEVAEGTDFGKILGHGPQRVASISPRQGACHKLFAESIESVNTVERLVMEGNIDCHFQRYGHLEAAYKPSHFEDLKQEQELLATRFNHETRLIPPENLASEIGSDLYHGALLDPVSAGVHPAKYIAGLISMADQAGVDLHEEVAAEAVERRGNKFRVRTNRGAIQADQIIVATNGYTGKAWFRPMLYGYYSLLDKLP